MSNEFEIEAVKKDLEQSATDGAVTVGRTLVGIVPLIGSPLAELINSVFGSPISRRRDKWLIYALEGLEEIRSKVPDFTLDNLSKNEQFVTATLQATQIALRNHQKEKLEALRNAIMNVALSPNSAEDQSMMFLDWIDTLTVSHIKVLSFARDPQKAVTVNNLPVKSVQGQRFFDSAELLPSLLSNPDIYPSVSIIDETVHYTKSNT
jgi:hypothetical protein